MQIKQKLMQQTWENGKKTNFQPNFGMFDPNLGPQKFFCEFYLYKQLDIVPSYHPIQFHGKVMS